MTTTTASTAFDSTLSKLGITRSAATSGVTVTTKAKAETLGQGDFLKLMTAQMQNQDPFNPVDNTQMVAQMAQFSSLAGISEMSTTLKAIQDKLGAASPSEAMAYIGKTVLTPGSTAYPRTSGGLAGAVELTGDATSVSVTISGPDGQAVKTLSLGQQAKGTATYDWDGKNEAGEDAGSGPFTISVIAGSGGKTIPSTNLVWAPVQSVSTTTGTPMLTLPGIGDVPTTDVRQIG